MVHIIYMDLMQRTEKHPPGAPPGKGIPRTKKQVAFLQLVLFFLFGTIESCIYISVAPGVPYELFDVAHSLRSVKRSLGSDSQAEFIIWPMNPAPTLGHTP